MTATPNTTEATSADRRRAVGVAVIFPATLAAVFIACVALRPAPAASPESVWSDVASRLDVDPTVVGQGRLAYRASCAACHGPDGDGVPRLGKPLRNSEFVQTRSDEGLLRYIIAGRQPDDPANTTGALMPGRGTPPLSDERVRQVIVYLRAIQEPDAQFASLDAWMTAPTSGGQSSGGAGAVSHPGENLFVASCSACHGPSGEGLEGLGLPLAGSEFVASKSDEELLRFIKTGRPIWDAENKTGLDMPAKGGNPALSDEDLTTIIGYIRAINDPASADNGASDGSTPTDGSEGAIGAGAISHPGKNIFVASCSACHGPSGEGLEGLGLPLAGSEFVASKSDEELLRFIKTGRPIWDAENKTGLDMPAKGGNPALSDEDLTTIIGYIRALNGENASQ